MELEFSQANVIMRLNRMKNVLSGGKFVNQSKLQAKMGDSLEFQKLYHKQLQAQNQYNLAQSEYLLQT